MTPPCQTGLHLPGVDLGTRKSEPTPFGLLQRTILPQHSMRFMRSKYSLRSYHGYLKEQTSMGPSENRSQIRKTIRKV